MKKIRVNEVFKPGTFPQYTYISRMSSEINYSYELRLKQALNTSGYLTSIIGPSKIGKTVLCEKVIGQNNIVSLTGNDFRISNDFWTIVAKRAGMCIEGEQSEMSTYEGEDDLGVKRRSIVSRERYFSDKDSIINYFKENDLVLVLDDFHYAPRQLQFDIAYQLKDAIRKEFKAIVISLPHRADDAIRKNPDLSGRLSLISIEPWDINDLKEIAVTGFKTLGVGITDEFAEMIAIESLTSPQLMQSICLSLSTILDIDSGNVSAIDDEEVVKESYRFTTSNLYYKEVVKKLKDGPPTRGQKRKSYKLIDGEESDIYGLILKAIAEDPPGIALSLDEMKSRIYKLLINDDRVDRRKIIDSLKILQEIMSTSESLYQVFEWKDNQIYVLEPLFLFYLRWGVF